jgi:hypothetical protein
MEPSSILSFNVAAKGALGQISSSGVFNANPPPKYKQKRRYPMHVSHVYKQTEEK